MKSQRILIVDDEKNIRLTLTQALEPTGYAVETSVNGEDALKKLDEKEFGLILLDLKMPGMGGLEFLRRITEQRPDIRVVIISAYGTVDNAVDAMKLGAVDFIQKPFTPREIRELVQQIMDREQLEESKVSDYDSRLQLAKRSISDRRLDGAMEHVRKAIGRDPSRPEGFNLLGALQEMEGDCASALKNYRAALDLDPSYRPAQENLERATRLRDAKGGINLG